MMPLILLGLSGMNALLAGYMFVTRRNPRLLPGGAKRQVFPTAWALLLIALFGLLTVVQGAVDMPYGMSLAMISLSFVCCVAAAVLQMVAHGKR
ncbi:hypothetical protein [Nonomuraea sp. NPDC046570]|uniref:hypothetical protein n=1 Tax=Nonomuraea sp. NPDC046570 TaxID=3155255 RepID=UPI0033E388D9